ncbi:MAG: hypothetical protein JSR44_07000 [Spirochaetes bacterium]|nr:hypothetical protein [Spirochaetota bacterium]
MQFLTSSLTLRILLSLLFLMGGSYISAHARVRDVNLARNQVTVMSNKAGAFGLGAKIYFFRGGKKTGSAQVTQAYHTKVIARINEGAPQIGDDAALTPKAPPKATKANRVTFSAASVAAHEFMVEVAFESQEKQERKLVLNSEVAAQLKGAPGYMGLSATLLKELDIVWENGALSIEHARLSDRSAFELSAFVAADLYAKVKPDAASRSSTVRGKIRFKKKGRDLPQLADSLAVEFTASPQSTRVQVGSAYKVKVYANELFAGELIYRPSPNVAHEVLYLNPLDLAPATNQIEVRLIEATGNNELLLETDNTQLIGTLAVDPAPKNAVPRIRVVLAPGADAAVEMMK